MDYTLELGVSQDYSLADLILSLKRILQREFKIWDIGVKIAGVSPNTVTKPDGVGTHYIMRVVSLLVSVPVTINDPKIFYDTIKTFTEHNDTVILLSRF